MWPSWLSPRSAHFLLILLILYQLVFPAAQKLPTSVFWEKTSPHPHRPSHRLMHLTSHTSVRRPFHPIVPRRDMSSISRNMWALWEIQSRLGVLQMPLNISYQSNQWDAFSRVAFLIKCPISICKLHFWSEIAFNGLFEVCDWKKGK